MDCGDFATVLPIEITEQIFFCLSDEDIIKCSQVCRNWGRIINDDYFWRHLCINRGLTNVHKEEFSNKTGVESWREFYWIKSNWKNKRFTYYTVEDRGDLGQMKLNRSTLYIPYNNVVKVYDIENVPKKIQELETFICECDSSILRVDEQFVVHASDNIMTIYQKNNSEFVFLKIIYFNDKILRETNSYENYIEEYSSISSASHLREIIERCFSSLIIVELRESVLVVYKSKAFFIWLLDVSQIDVVPIHDDKVTVHEIQIVFPRVYVLMSREYSFVVKVYDINKKSWIIEMMHSNSKRKVVFLGRQLIVGNKYIVTCGLYDRSLLVRDKPYSHFKLWKTEDGTLLRTFNIQTVNFWCFVIGDVVLCSVSPYSMAIWNPFVVKKLKPMEVNKIFGSLTILDNLLIVSNTESFDVWDWQVGAKLYCVETTKNCGAQLINSMYYVQSAITKATDTGIYPKVVIYNFREQKPASELGAVV